MKLSVFNILFILFYSIGKGQAVKPLTVGDTVPDIEIGNIINYHKPAVSLSELKDKLILIDFWGTTCKGCIEALPKIDSLQTIFKDDMQVFTVTTFDTEEKVKRTLKNVPKVRNVKLPVVLGDKLKAYFPHDIVSHVVWIDGKGIVRAITGTEYVNAGNIKKIISGEHVNWPVKQDVLSFNYQKPFLELSTDNAAPVAGDLLYYSALTGHMQGVDATTRELIDSFKNTITVNSFNHDLLQLGMMFADEIPGVLYALHPKRTVFKNVKDKGRYLQSGYTAEWMAKNTYCHSISIPLHYDVKARRKIVREDVRRWFGILGIDIKIEKASMKYLKLVRTGSGDYQVKNVKLPKAEDNTGNYILRDYNSAGIAQFLNYNVSNIPWVEDLTGIAPDFKANFLIAESATYNLKALNAALQKYGLQLIEAEGEMDVYVIEEH